MTECLCLLFLFLSLLSSIIFCQVLLKASRSGPIYLKLSTLCVCDFWLHEAPSNPLLITIYSSLVWRRWFVPYFIVELDSVFKGIVLLKAVVWARQLLHCAPYCESGWLGLTLGDWSTRYATSDIGFSTLDLSLFIEPFIFLGDPAGHHIVMGVLGSIT